MPAAKLLVLLLPPLLSLAGQSGTPKLLCLATSILALLLSVAPHGDVLDSMLTPMLAPMLLWAVGMAIAAISLRERIHQLRAAGVRQLK
jgi:hypothetical protein